MRERRQRGIWRACACVAATTDDFDAAIKKLFGIRGELKRIKTADAVANLIHAGDQITHDFRIVAIAIEDDHPR